MDDRVSSGSRYERDYGYCRARRVGDRIEVAGTAPVMADGGDPPPDAGGQFARCAEIARAAVEQLGGDWRDVVRTRIYVADASLSHEVGLAHRAAFGDAQPVMTQVVAGLLDPRWLVELEVVVADGAGGAARTADGAGGAARTADGGGATP